MPLHALVRCYRNRDSPSKYKLSVMNYASAIFAYNFVMPSIALVTGAAHRLGKAFAMSLARQGYALLLHYHSAESEAFRTADEIRALGARVHLAQADLTQPNGLQSLIATLDSVIADFRSSTFDLLVNSAAVMPVGRPHD